MVEALAFIIQKIVGLAFRFRAVVAVMARPWSWSGLPAFRQLPIEANPNPYLRWSRSCSTPWLERRGDRTLCDYPMEMSFWTAGLDDIRSQSLWSDVKCYFRWGRSTRSPPGSHEAAGIIQLPSGLQAQLSPGNATGEIFRYR